MTILGAKNQLITHFLTHDTFHPVSHAFEVTYDRDTADFREELVRAALGELEQAGFVRKLSQPDRGDIWVLVQPMSTYVQQVQVGSLVAGVVADVINHYNEVEGSDVLCDKTKISEADFLRLIDILGKWEQGIFHGEEDPS